GLVRTHHRPQATGMRNGVRPVALVPRACFAIVTRRRMALIKCPECTGTLSDSARFCPHCGWGKETYLDASGKVPTVSPQRVALAAVQMPFLSIVKATLKWAVASAPAVLLLVLIAVLGLALLSAIAEQLHLQPFLGR